MAVGSRQRERRRDRARTPDRRERRTRAHDAALCAAGPRQGTWPRDALPGRRRRSGSQRGANELMTSSSLAVARRPSRVVAIGIVGFAGALALASQVAVPIPGTPVPITLQPLVVVLAGMWLGPMAGAASMLLYLAAGAAGLPVFSPFGAPGIARFAGPTGGYLFAYPLAAFVAGALARRSTSLLGRWAAALAGTTVLLAGGLAQLAVITGGVSSAIPLAIHPFLPLDAVKALIAALLVPRSTFRAPV